MKVAVVFSQPDHTLADSRDVLDEVQLVQQAAGDLDWESRSFALSRQGPQVLAEMHTQLAEYAPDVVFNLVENWRADPRGQALVAWWWEEAGWRYSGSNPAALWNTTDKIISKALLAAHHLPTPAWQIYSGGAMAMTLPPPWILKPAWEDASVGIDDASVVYEESKLRQRLSDMAQQHRQQPILIEAFIEGREFNVSLLEHPDGSVEALPPAEICFEAWPSNKPKIVSYQAKWDATAFEYQNTRRTFVKPPELCSQLATLAQKCWTIFQLGGYGRVDIRQDNQGRMYVLEVNANPGIAPDSGFIAALQAGGYTIPEAIAIIVRTALRPNRKAERL